MPPFAINKRCISLLLAWLLVLQGCSSLEQHSSRGPSAIGVLNSSGIHIQQISFHAPASAGKAGYRVGLISPLPEGITQVLGRGSQPRPLPQLGVLSWVDVSGQTRSRTIDPGILTNQPSGAADEMLLIEVLADGRVSARFVRSPY